MTRTKGNRSRNAGTGPSCPSRPSQSTVQRPAPTTPPRGDQGPYRESEPGEVIASFPRDVDGEPGVLRITLGEFNGRPLVQTRIWVKTRDGRWLPTKAGTTFRCTEMDAVVAAYTKSRDKIRDGGRLTRSPEVSHPPARADSRAVDGGRRDTVQIVDGNQVEVREPWPVDPEMGLPQPPWL